MTDTKKSPEVPSTKGMLDETRNELKSDIASLKLEMKAGFENTDSKIDAVKSEIKALNSSVHRMLALYEEQEARNKYVLDGYQALHDRQDQLEEKHDSTTTQILEAIKRMNTTN